MTLTLHKIAAWDKLQQADSKIIRFPAGEPHIETWGHHQTEIAYLQGADGNDLITLAMWADACRRTERKAVAVIPYLPGARADRGIPFGAKVYADLINSMGLTQVITLDPHSDVMPALLNNLTVVRLDQLDVWDTVSAELGEDVPPGHLILSGVIAPDAGARKRAEQVAYKFDVPVYQAWKNRDFRTGKLSGFGCEPLPDTGILLVVDDICDGGGTFIGLAELTGLPRERLALWATHGVFSNGAERLDKHYAHVFTTDSHPGVIEDYEVPRTFFPILNNLTRYIERG